MPVTLESPAASMKLVDALKIVAKNPPALDVDTFMVQLVCSFTPLHLQTFLNAELRLRFPSHHVKVGSGLYDDIPGTLRDMRGQRIDAVALVLEWFDLDARLGIRRLGGWSHRQAAEIVGHAAMWLAQVSRLVEQVAQTSAVVISLPTLPLPPLFCTPGGQASADEIRLRECLWTFAASVAANPKVRVISDTALSALSPAAERLNVKSTWVSGFPYQVPHAARLAELLARAIHNPQPKKGLITDLDNTLWSGIVGDDGVEGVSWDLDHQSQGHGLYQQLLSALSEEGVLVGVASKNDPQVVEQAFTREDLIVSSQHVFPFAVSWGSKAEAVSRILKAWNVSADSVVFVDDNPTELAEVAAAHPEVQCLRFPTNDPAAVYQLLGQLRDLFGRQRVSAEDAIRLDSLRARAGASDAADDDAEGFSEALLEQADAEVTVDFGKDGSDPRPLELVNKTNQFNINGKRITDRAWADFLDDPTTFLMTVKYKDRFGPLGTVAVVGGRVAGPTVFIDTWVMSCRAFARRIEHQCLRVLFDRFSAGEVVFDYVDTPRNGPLTRFLSEISGSAAHAGLTLSEASFAAACPTLLHRIDIKDGTSNG